MNIPSVEEIQMAVKIVKPIAFMYQEEKDKVKDMVKVLCDLAESYLSASAECPEKRQEEDCGCVIDGCGCRIFDYNNALDACLLAYIKKTAELREALKDLCDACLIADANEELSEFVDGSLLDKARQALGEEPK